MNRELMDSLAFVAALGPLWDSHPVAADALTRHDDRLRRRLAEVEQALQELAHWRIAQSHDAVQMRSFARAVLDGVRRPLREPHDRPWGG